MVQAKTELLPLAAYASSSSEDEDCSNNEKAASRNDSGDDQAPDKKPKLRNPCQTCNQEEFKYKCPKCLFLSCSLPCSKKHKQEFDCDGQRPSNQHALKIPMTAMNIDILRKDMTMIDKGINISNRAKRDNIEAKVKVQGGQRTVTEMKQLKKQKNLRHFLRKKRSIYFVNCPATAKFKRQSINKTRLQTSGAEPAIFWTVEIKFVLPKQAGGSSVQAEVRLNEVPESTLLDTLCSVQYLKSHSDAGSPEQSSFLEWITDSNLQSNYNLQTKNADRQISIKQVPLTKQGQKLEAKDTTRMEKEEGELDLEGNGEQVEQATGRLKAEPVLYDTKLPEQMEWKRVKLDQDAGTLRDFLTGAFVMEYPTIYVQLQKQD